MRVLLTTDTVGGVWTYTKELTEGLLQHGCSVTLVSFGPGPSGHHVAWTNSATSSYRNHFRYISSTVPLEWMPDNDRSFTDAAPVLEQIARDVRPDLFHSNQFCFGALNLNVPCLLVAHSDVLSWADACTPGGLEPSPWLTRYIRLVQQGLVRADAIVAPSAWMLGALGNHFALPAAQHVIPNGRSVPTSPDPPQGRHVQAVTAGRLDDPAKNLALLEQVRTLPVVVAGSLPASRRPSHLQYRGVLSERDLLSLFRESEIYLAPSLYEPFGLAPLEAALCGCAIVAHDIPSLREVWGNAALFFRTSADLERHLTALASNRSLLNRMQAASAHRAREFTRERMSDHYLALYRDLLTSSKPRSSPASPAYVH